MATDSPEKHPRRLLLILAGVTLAALLVRLVCVALIDIPTADPWRHLVLVGNIQSGAGFTLFERQPYIWYSPLWHYLAAAVTPPEGVKWLAAVLSAGAAPFLALYVHRISDRDWRATLAAGVLMAGFGPAVSFTCQLGSEALGILLLTAALWTSTFARRLWTAGLAGLMLGIALSLRPHFILATPLLLPMLRRPKQTAALALATALPLAAHWWRNHSIISRYEFIFTWDGVATRSDQYDFLSTLVPQWQVAAAEGTARLYERILPVPEWLFRDGRLRWEMLLFFIIAGVCVFASRRAAIIVAALLTVIYLLLLDSTRSSYFFRIWVPVFPIMFAAIGLCASWLARNWRRYGPVPAVLLVVLCLATGARELAMREMPPVEAMTPPPGLLTGSHYMVNSGYFHPESLMYRYPDKHFIGMPIDPADFAALRRAYPQYHRIIWHDFNVQEELLAAVEQSGEYETVAEATNIAGYSYRVMEATSPPEAPATAHPPAVAPTDRTGD